MACNADSFLTRIRTPYTTTHIPFSVRTRRSDQLIRGYRLAEMEFYIMFQLLGDRLLCRFIFFLTSNVTPATGSMTSL